MLARHCRTADAWLRRPSSQWWWPQVSPWCFAALLGKACATLPLPFLGPDPADPYVPVPYVGYRSVIAPYVSLRPTKPGDWQKQNQSVAPKGETPAHQQ